MIASVYEAPTDLAGYDPTRDADGYWFDGVEADRRIRFFEVALTHTKGHLRGKPLNLEKWQRDAIATIFGWKRPDGMRRYRESFWFLPRKNGKSTLAAGLSVCVLYLDNEGGAECYAVAGDLDQTDMVYGCAKEMVEQSKALSKRADIIKSRKRIVHGSSFFRAIPADASGAHGFNPHFVVGDELHVWRNRDLKDTLHTGTGYRMQPLELYITTAGYDTKTICGETYYYASKVRDGQIRDATFFPLIYEAPKDWDWKEEKTWARANPNYGVSVRKEYIAAECQKAIENPGYENTFRRLHLNQWTEQKTRWLKMDDWRKCKTSNERLLEASSS